MSLLITTSSLVAAGFAGLGAAKVIGTPFMRARAEHVGLSAASYRLIGAAELAGAAGVLAGLACDPVGYAAGSGLLLLLGGAVVAHARQGDGLAELAPAVVFAAGTASYLLALGAAR